MTRTLHVDTGGYDSMTCSLQWVLLTPLFAWLLNCCDSIRANGMHLSGWDFAIHPSGEWSQRWINLHLVTMIYKFTRKFVALGERILSINTHCLTFQRRLFLHSNKHNFQSRFWNEDILNASIYSIMPKIMSSHWWWRYYCRKPNQILRENKQHDADIIDNQHREHWWFHGDSS